MRNIPIIYLRNFYTPLVITLVLCHSSFFAASQSKGGAILFVKGEVQGGDRKGEPLPSHEVNPDEIDIDDSSEEEKEDEDDKEDEEEEGKCLVLVAPPVGISKIQSCAVSILS